MSAVLLRVLFLAIPAGAFTAALIYAHCTREGKS